MPLSEPAPREGLHTRRITVRGFHREDGLFDVEAVLTDVKGYGFAIADRGWIGPDEPLHEMHLRLTIDEQMAIVAAEGVTERGPYHSCPGGAASFASLVGLVIRPGFLKEAAARMAGTAGCTHIRELMQQVATTAMQTMWPVRSKREAVARAQLAAAGADALRNTSAEDGSARLLNTCFAYASDGPVVRTRWPHLATGPQAAAAGDI